MGIGGGRLNQGALARAADRAGAALLWRQCVWSNVLHGASPTVGTGQSNHSIPVDQGNKALWSKPTA